MTITAQPSASASSVRRLLAHRIGGLPVLEKDNLIGIITTTDILRAVLTFPEFEK
jgi:CBS domain-containing protein